MPPRAEEDMQISYSVLSTGAGLGESKFATLFEVLIKTHVGR